MIILDSVVKAKKKYYSQTYGKMQIWTKKDKNGEPYWWWFSLSDESDNQADNDYNDETESDDEKDNDESNE